MTCTRRLAAIILSATATLVAQVSVTDDPRYRVAFANAQLRVLHLNMPAGDTSLDHRHDFDVATISMSNGSNTREQLSGQPWGKPLPSRPPGNASVTEYTGKAASHRVENLGKSPYQLFAVENLRKGGWSATPPISARATKLTAESRAFRIYDVRLGRDNVQTSHTHAQPTILVAIAGAVISDGPDKQAKAFAPAAVGLKQLTQP